MKNLHAPFFLVLSILLLLAGAAQSQGISRNEPRFSDRLVFGGNFGLSFGSYTSILVAPTVGYRVTDNFTAGLGLSYQYWRDNFYDVSNSIYGGMLYGRYNVFKGLFVEADFEMNNTLAYTFDNLGGYTSERKWIPSLLLGGGYYTGGNVGGFYISVLYDVIQNPNSPYYQIPIFRIGGGFSL
jgi:hypothetical protein